MGTRNLTIVKQKNKTKVSQYGQWKRKGLMEKLENPNEE